jgi:hypothetical protein
MTASTLIQSLSSRGFSVLADGDAIKVSPASALTDDERQAIRERKAELLTLLQSEPADDENPETHDSALVFEADGRELITELHAVGCHFMTVEGKPRLYYPPDMEAGLVQRVAALIAGRDETSKTFRRLVREEAV